MKTQLRNLFRRQGWRIGLIRIAFVLLLINLALMAARLFVWGKPGRDGIFALKLTPIEAIFFVAPPLFLLVFLFILCWRKKLAYFKGFSFLLMAIFTLCGIISYRGDLSFSSIRTTYLQEQQHFTIGWCGGAFGVESAKYDPPAPAGEPIYRYFEITWWPSENPPYPIRDSSYGATKANIGLGIYYVNVPGWNSFAIQMLVVPWWMPVAFLSLFPLTSHIVRDRKSYSAPTHDERGLCPKCGYDLIASKDRCPECGTPKPAPIAAH